MQKKVSRQQSTVLRTPTIVSDSDRSSEVSRYAQWLDAEKTRSNTPEPLEARRKYTEEAVRIIKVQGKELRQFAPFREAFSAYKTMTREQVVVLSLIALGTLLGLVVYGMGMVIAIVALITVCYVSTLLVNFFLTMRALNHP